MGLLMPRKPKQTEQLPLDDIPEARPDWEISEKTKREGKHWFPIWRKQLNKAASGAPESNPS